MTKLLGWHTLLGAIAAVIAGTLLAQSGAQGLFQIFGVVLAYIVVALVSARWLEKRQAAKLHAEESEEEVTTRFEHFDARQMEKIQEDRAATGRREDGE